MANQNLRQQRYTELLQRYNRVVVKVCYIYASENAPFDDLYQEPLEKEIMTLWLDEHSYDEISKITGLSKSNVAVRLHRIKEKLMNLGREFSGD